MKQLCPACKNELVLDIPLKINQSVVCSTCGLELEVIWLYPLELAKVLSYQPDPSLRDLNPAEGSAKK